MAKIQTVFECTDCGFQSQKWLGRCPQCHQWNSFQEDLIEKINLKQPSSSPIKLSEIKQEKINRVVTGMNEFDRVVGGGVVKGSLILLGGEPGVGKSTLLTNLAFRLSSITKCEEVLYVSGEESTMQISLRAKRLGYERQDFLVLNETNWGNIKELLNSKKFKYFILDSIQTTISQEVQSVAGSVSQIREITFELMNIAKTNEITCFIIGHVTKDGVLAGPKVLEHMVDIVLYIEGETTGQYRSLRTIKNRFGSTNEVGLFELSEAGFDSVLSPAIRFSDQQNGEVIGRSTTCIIEGTRPMIIEIQALVVENKCGNIRRITQGYDSSRLSMLVAIIEKYLNIQISFNDIYLNVAGGYKINTRECDLAVVGALLSSHLMKPISLDNVMLGEVGLSGEIRSVTLLELRIKELIKEKYKILITAEGFKKLKLNNINLKMYSTLKQCRDEQFS